MRDQKKCHPLLPLKKRKISLHVINYNKKTMIDLNLNKTAMKQNLNVSYMSVSCTLRKLYSVIYKIHFILNHTTIRYQ